MDFFRLLSRGAKLDGVAFKNEKVEPDSDNIARDLDFFHTHGAPVAETTKKEKKEKKVVENAVIPAGKLNVSGSDIPVQLGSFEDLESRFNVPAGLISRIRFAKPTQIQAEAIPGILHDRDILACAPTGSGKTLAYVLPLTHLLTSQPGTQPKTVRAIIMVPTKELAQQVAQTFTLLTRGTTSIKVEVLTKSLLARITSETGASPGDVLIATPLRLVRAIKSISCDNVRHLVLDEADKLFDHAFVAQTDAVLAELRGKAIQRTFLSATMPSSIETLALDMMTLPLRILISPGSAASGIDQKLVYAGSEAGKLLAIRQMIKTGEMAPPVLIFVQSVERANALFHELVYDGVNVDVIHGERTESQRRAVVERFKRAEIWVLICTDVLARGVDVKGVNLVVNYDVPQSSQAYIHRVGRTGRAGKAGKAVTFFTKDDVESVKIVVNVMKESGCEVAEWMTKLGKVSKKTKSQLKRKPADRDGISTQPGRVKADLKRKKARTTEGGKPEEKNSA